MNGGRLMPVRHEFPFSLPDYAGIYPRIFPGPISFDCGHAAIWFLDRDLAAPVRRDGAALEAFLRGCPGNVVLPWITTRATSARVLALLRRGEPTWPGMAEAARQLNLSVSTLQRRLTAEGTTFQLLKDQLRRDLAILKLSTSREPLARIAAELGFSESAVFQRAFKAWTRALSAAPTGFSAALGVSTSSASLPILREASVAAEGLAAFFGRPAGASSNCRPSTISCGV